LKDLDAVARELKLTSAQLAKARANVETDDTVYYLSRSF
jgi:hypothetical protein